MKSTLATPPQFRAFPTTPHYVVLVPVSCANRRSVVSQGFSKGLGDNNWKLLVCHLWVPTTFLRCICLTWEWERWLPTELCTRKCINQLNYSYSSVKKKFSSVSMPTTLQQNCGQPNLRTLKPFVSMKYCLWFFKPNMKFLRSHTAFDSLRGLGPVGNSWVYIYLWGQSVLSKSLWL